MFQVAVDTVCTHFSPSTMASLVESVTNYLLEKSGDGRKKIGQLLIQLVNKNLLLKTQFVKGLQNVMEFAADLVVDVPKFWDYFGELFGAFSFRFFSKSNLLHRDLIIHIERAST